MTFSEAVARAVVALDQLEFDGEAARVLAEAKIVKRRKGNGQMVYVVEPGGWSN